MYVNSLKSRITIYLAREAQIALLLVQKVTVLAKYSDFANVFSEESANILPEQTRVNKHNIKLEKAKQPSYGLIYSLKPIELQTLKTYIKTNLANSFIQASKLPADAQILLVHKPNGTFCLFTDYRGFNNLIIHNKYPLPLIGKSLDWSG